MMIDTRKEDFIDDYFQAAIEEPHESRSPHQIYSDAEVEWESNQIDLAYERFVQRHVDAK